MLKVVLLVTGHQVSQKGNRHARPSAEAEAGGSGVGWLAGLGFCFCLLDKGSHCVTQVILEFTM